MMEPLLLSEGSKHRGELTELALEVASQSASFKSSLPRAMLIALAETVRAMNCYYSNLIEGHNTHPIDIERALQGDYSKNNQKRNLQLEAKAHITVQAWMENHIPRHHAYSQETICEIHKHFYELLPPELLLVEDPLTHEKVNVVPGELRHRDVRVGNHIAISAGAVPKFLTRYESVYNRLNKTESLLAVAAAHHRLLWIHPFLDGNGRVARLVSHHALFTMLDTNSVWSISRGLARQSQRYKEYLANCDLPRRNDLDGRGNLSEEELAKFSQFFLETCLDQIHFMKTLMQPDRLRVRILSWAKEEIAAKALPEQTFRLLEAILYRGEMSRTELADTLSVSDRHARRYLAALVEKGIIVSDTQKSPLRLAFPIALSTRWMPGLFPESE